MDYDELRRILQTELDKHKDEPNYDKLDWQIDHWIWNQFEEFEIFSEVPELRV